MILPWRKKNDAGPDEWYFERHHVCGIVPFSLDTFAVQVSASALHMITNFLNFQERKDQWMPRCTLALQCWLRDLHANNLQYCSCISRSPQHLLPWPPSGLRGGISEAAWGTTFPPDRPDCGLRLLPSAVLPSFQLEECVWLAGFIPWDASLWKVSSAPGLQGPGQAWAAHLGTLTAYFSAKDAMTAMIECEDWQEVERSEVWVEDKSIPDSLLYSIYPESILLEAITCMFYSSVYPMSVTVTGRMQMLKKCFWLLQWITQKPRVWNSIMRLPLHGKFLLFPLHYSKLNTSLLYQGENLSIEERAGQDEGKSSLNSLSESSHKMMVIRKVRLVDKRQGFSPWPPKDLTFTGLTCPPFLEQSHFLLLIGHILWFILLLLSAPFILPGVSIQDFLKKCFL